MSCQRCNNTPTSSNCPHLIFGVDGTYLTAKSNQYQFESLDLEPVVEQAETDTDLQFDLATKSFIYTSERAITQGTAVRTIPLSTITETIKLTDLADVAAANPNNGDLLSYNEATSSWQPYNIPTGTPVSSVGIDVNNKLVKQSSTGGGGATASVPVGGTIIWPGPVNSIPAGFAVADGGELNRQVYSVLFGIIGTLHGGGNGTTTFNKPNLTGRVPVGLDTNQPEMDTIGETGGEKAHVLSYDEMPRHSHGVNDYGHSHRLWSVGQESNVFQLGGTSNRVIVNGGNPDAGNGRTGNSGANIGIQDAGNYAAHNNMQPFTVMLYIIRII